MSARLKRTWQLGMLAKDVARTRWQHDIVEARLRLAQRMQQLRGIPQKIGQILAVMELSNPQPSYAALTEGEATLPHSEVVSLIGKHLGQNVDRCFRALEPNGIAASLAQVHRAILHDGRDVAVKIQYPDIADDVDFDLRALGWLTAPVGGLRRGGFDLEAYQREVGTMIHQELDYRQEARTMARFSSWAREHDGLAVPEVIPELSGERILTMTWIDGERFSAVCGWPEAQREEVAHRLVRLFLTGCLRWHCLHADPHPGNYRFRTDGKNVTIGLLDFGCVHNLDEATVQALRTLLDTARAGRMPALQESLSQFAALGFQAAMLVPMAHLLPALTEVLLEPFRISRPFAVANWKLGERVAEVLGPFRWNFRMAGPVSLIYFIRAFQGLIQHVQALKVAVNWRAILDEVADGSTPTIPRAPQPIKEACPAKSTHLRLRVREGNQTRVELTFIAHLAESLPELVPPEIEERLIARTIDVARIARESAAGGFEPGELFVLHEAGKEVRVWLE